MAFLPLAHLARLPTYLLVLAAVDWLPRWKMVVLPCTCSADKGPNSNASFSLDPAYICSNAQIAHDFASYITSLFPENDQQALELQKVVCGTRSATVGAASVSSTPESAIEPFLAPIDASPSFTSASLSSGGVVLSSGSGNAALGLRDSTPVGSGSDTGLSWPFFVLGCILVILGVGVQVGGMVL